MSLCDYLRKNNTEKLEQFMNCLSKTNRMPDYYVNWTKVEKNTKRFELELNILNSLLGKENIEDEARKIFSDYPKTLQAVPSLIASRDSRLEILNKENSNISTLNFNNPDISKIDDYIKFLKDTGLLDFMKNNIGRNLVDFVYGVETGIDSNARKNKSGTTMGRIIHHFVDNIIKENPNLETKMQASAPQIKDYWNIDVPIDKSTRRYDEVIYDRTNQHLFLIETNYYNGRGSKLKAVAGEFSELNQSIITNNPKITFIWITDGQGWLTARLPLEEAFGKIKYIFNLKMIRDGYLEDLIHSKI